MNNKTATFIFYALVSAILIALFHFYVTDLFKTPWIAALALASFSFLLIFFMPKQNQTTQDETTESQPENQFAKIGEAIGIKASELAINSAEISFFLDQLSTAIEHSSEDVDRLATAAEQMSVNSKQ